MTRPGADTIAPMPGWITSGCGETPEDVAFLSGAALGHLHLVAGAQEIPHALWRDRLALMAAEASVVLAGRREGAGALRDALHLARPGDDPGPTGRIFRQWGQAAARTIAALHLAKVLEGVSADEVALCLDAAGTPVARAIGWDHLVPLLAVGLRPRDLRLKGSDLRQACDRAVVRGAVQAVRLAAELARAATRLRAAAPKLRAKKAGRAVDLFLSRDALAASALDFMSDRAARRLCDRLVDLGALRELTGRDTFRLYGL